jgi:hypothetical protein
MSALEPIVRESWIEKFSALHLLREASPLLLRIGDGAIEKAMER